jgi:acetyl esterase/lipase
VSSDARAILSRPAPPPDATVAYGALPDQVADVWFPTAAGRVAAAVETDRPLVIVIHGGFWRAEYDRAHVGPLASALAAEGWPVAAIEYRRIGQEGGGWPGTFADVVAAIGRTPELVRHALTDRGLAAPPDPPVLLGHSAGGQLALWAATAVTAPVRGVVALAPVADLADAYARGLDSGAAADLLGGGPAEVPERYAHVDPRARLPLPVPAILLHGVRDAQVPTAMSRTYAAAAQAAGGRVTLVELDGMEHFGLIDPRSTAWQAVTSALRSIGRGSHAIDAPKGTE